MKKPLAALLLVTATGGTTAVVGANTPARKPAPTHALPAPPATTRFPMPKPSVKPMPPARADGLMPAEYMPTSELHAGMHGYGLSVFRGNKIERFDVAILGVVHKANNGRDLILARLSGPGLISSSNFIEGMSGSPVYVNGKIVGAVSMSFQFVREPIGFLTPITDMLDAWDPALPQSPDFPHPAPPAMKSVSLDTPIVADGHRYTRLAITRPGVQSARGARDADTLVAQPCMTRLSVAGVPATRFSRLAKTLKSFGVDAQEGPGAASSSELTGSPFVPGGGIGVSLMTGDIDMTGIGTLTYRRGNRIVAFGHPFLGIGPIDAPMFSVFIHDIFPSYEISFKEGSPVKRVGAISQDLPFSIGGMIGAEPKMVPVTVHVDDKMLGRDRIFHAQIIRHPQMTPALLPTAADTAIVNVHGQPGDAMATVTTEVVADEVGTIRRTNRVYDATVIDDAATADLNAIVGLLSSNPFYPVAIRSVNMTVTIERGRQTAQIERIFLKQTKFAPGDTVDVGVVLKPYKQDRVIKTIKVKIPPTAPTGSLILTVQGGSAAAGAIRIAGFTLLPSAGADYASAANIQQLVRRYEDKDRNDALVAHLALPASAVSVGGEKLSDLPPNIDNAMRNGTRSSGVRLERDEVKVSALTPYVLSGGQALAIRVVRPDQPTSSSPTFPGFSQGSGGGIPAGAPPATGSGSSIPGVPPLTERSGKQGGIEQAAAMPTAGFNEQTTPAAQTAPGQSQPTVIPAAPPAAGPIRVSFGSAVPPSAMASAADPSMSTRSVVRPPAIWRQDGVADFRQGKLDGVTVTSRGDIRLAPKLTKVTETDQPYFWSLAEGDGGTVYAGGGDTGIVYRLTPGGKAEPWARTGELEVQSLVRASDGTLYAGTAPHGRIYKIGADGKPSLFFQTGEKYVLQMALSPDGKTLYAGTGGPSGCVYAIPIAGGGGGLTPAKPIYTSSDSSVSALAAAPDGMVYAGTAPNGLVVKIDPTAAPATNATVLYDAVAPSISGLAIGKDGSLYAATAPRGILYRIDPTETGAASTARVLYDRTPSGGTLTGLQIGQDGTLYTASGSTVIAVDPSDRTVRTFEAESDIDILSLLRGTNGDLWISTGNTASVYRLNESAEAATQGRFVSTVLDAQAKAQWGTIRWDAGLPAGATLSLETRSGNTTTPDATWSSWSRGYNSAAGDQVASPAGRYLQYSAAFGSPATTPGTSPVLRSIEVFYLTPNQAPQVDITTPRGGEVWRGKKLIRWNGADPDRDTLSYTVSISSDGGKTWTPLNAPGTLSAQAGAPQPPASVTATPLPGVLATPLTMNAADSARALSDLEAELAKHPEISPEMRARILADAPGQLNPASVPSGASSDISVAPQFNPLAPGSAVTRGTQFPLDTASLSDGEYLLKVVATDKPSNPTGALTDEKVSGAFRIANRPPTLVLLNHMMKMNDDRSVHIEGIALHPAVAIRGVQYRIDGGEWLAASAADGIFDSPSEAFTITTAPVAPGKAHLVEVMAVDEAGNTLTQRTMTPPG